MIIRKRIHWRSFLECLVYRGLNGLRLIVRDAHRGFKVALRVVFPSVFWQGCQFHLQQNAQAYVTKKDMKVKLQEAYEPYSMQDMAEAERIIKQTILKYEKAMPKLATWMGENIFEGLTIFNFPAEHRRRYSPLKLQNALTRKFVAALEWQEYFPMQLRVKD